MRSSEPSSKFVFGYTGTMESCLAAVKKKLKLQD